MDLQIEQVKKDALSFLAKGNDLVKKVELLSIEKPEDVVGASLILKDCQTTEQDLESKRVEITKPLNDFLKEANALFKETAQPILEAKSGIKKKMLEYNEKIERERKEKEEAGRKAEEERLAKIEAERKAREDEERKKREEEARILAERRAKLDADQAKFEEEKLAAERQKRIEQEQEQREKEEAEAAEAKRIEEEEKERLANVKVKGVAKTWKWRIADEPAIPRAFCSPDSKKINEAIKAGVRTIEGLEIYEETSVK